MLAAGEFAQGFPGLHRHFAVGFRSEAQDHLARVDVGLDPRLPLVTPSSVTVPLSLPRKSTSWSVFQLMPFPPLPSFFSSGPIDVNFL